MFSSEDALELSDSFHRLDARETDGQQAQLIDKKMK